MDLLHIYEWIDIKTILLFSLVFLLLLRDLHHIDHKKIRLQLLQKKYGNILSIRILGPRIVVLIGYKTVKEAYLEEGDNLADRHKLPIFYDIFGDKCLVAANGYSWKHQRRFALSTLRNFGLGKKSLEPSISLECRFLNEAISNENGRPFNPQILLNNTVSNVICVLVFGNRFEYSDNDFQTLLKKISDGVFFWGSIWAQLPLTVIHAFTREWRPADDVAPPSNPRDYIDCFLAEMEKIRPFLGGTLDLFIGGTETASVTLYWGLLYMMKYTKVQEETDGVVGGSQQPSSSDRDNMPYTNAIHEIQRIGNIVSLNLIRSTVKETPIGKYFIPKGTVVIGSLTSVLFDEFEWETSHSFNLSHFLDAEGKFRKRDAFLPFSLVCPGEQLARMELFLFFSSLLQRFTFSLPARVEPSFDYLMGTTRCPLPYKLCAVPC
uniref:Cytochrome P450, family 2, subfamily P, polypeptide 6 n=1 Tax=Sinocyclocheilus rhinocerous TaxID=307959 RepID=A0A673GAJ3_9TELE